MIRLNHTSFYVSDLDESIGFFGHLGFSETRRIEVGHLNTILCFLADATGEGIIELMHIEGRVESEDCHPSAFGYAHVGLEADDIHAEEERLRKLGVKFREEIKHVPNGPKVGFIEGPDGITVEVVEYPGSD